jgi:acetyl esterase/lipase
MQSTEPRQADLRLRGAGTLLRPRVSWPRGGRGTGVLVFLPDPASTSAWSDAFCRASCDEAGFVVLSVADATFEAATTTLEWAADHAPELGADPARLVIAGQGSGAGLAAAAALRARGCEWPALTRQVLAGPGLDALPLPAASMVGVAPATVVEAHGYAARLRQAGVEVDELRSDEFLSIWRS